MKPYETHSFFPVHTAIVAPSLWWTMMCGALWASAAACCADLWCKLLLRLLWHIFRQRSTEISFKRH